MAEQKTDIVKKRNATLNFAIIMAILFVIVGIPALIAHQLGIGWAKYPLFAIYIGLFVAFYKWMKIDRTFEEVMTHRIDLKKRVLVRIFIQEGVEDVIKEITIPFHAISSVVLAPSEKWVDIGRAGLTIKRYHYEPIILIVYEEEGEKYFFGITCKTNSETNEWLDNLQKANLPLTITDECVEGLIGIPHPEEAIEHDFARVPLQFNGDISSYFNRKKGYYYPYYPVYKKGETMTLEENSIRTFKWKVRHVFIATSLALLMVVLLAEAGLMTANGAFIGITLFGSSHLLYSYSFKHFTKRHWFGIVSLLTLNYLTVSSISKLVNINQLDIQVFSSYFLFFVPLLFVSYKIRKNKPAQHHYQIQHIQRRLRYKGFLAKST
ncbi:hypothetical protein HXA34_07055 [Salipaludibacillus agaradhaerens]|uniref:hypothetical protein n=1 Tax=Salipaludibacillus agaradhaerens TaxID=76935 RepID=UPI0021514FEF|nr:hypothetical protein [Salipaludibacillus agaradhaerens]MCR6106035.1 hypothetical protein [Salipaludibacillus agaradhaerens]MCR6118068.1 hypothetical protein [Salipaludibacillus agaradhaerens]